MAKKNKKTTNGTHNDVWPWDPTRPVAGQYEEHLERMRLSGERIAEQTRHDVAASVVRHEELHEDAEVAASHERSDPGCIAEEMQRNGHDHTVIRQFTRLTGIEVTVGDEPEQGVEIGLEIGEDPDDISVADLAKIAHAPSREPPTVESGGES
jgi:hypothetical protein